MPKKAVKSGTQGIKNKDLKMHIDLTGSNKVSILDKSPLDKSPPTNKLYRISPQKFKVNLPSNCRRRKRIFF